MKQFFTILCLLTLSGIANASQQYELSGSYRCTSDSRAVSRMTAWMSLDEVDSQLEIEIHGWGKEFRGYAVRSWVSGRIVDLITYTLNVGPRPYSGFRRDRIFEVNAVIFNEAEDLHPTVKLRVPFDGPGFTELDCELL